MNLDNYFYVTEILANKVKAKSVFSSPEKIEEEKEFYFSDWNDEWWVAPIPQIFHENKQK